MKMEMLIICESNKIHQLQMEDVDLQPYMKYHSHGLLSEDQNVARNIVLESQHYVMIDGVNENPNQPGRWCIVVPKKLHSQLLNEAHAGCFGGHLSEKKVYDKLRRNYWWYGLRRDVRRFCRSCLNCVTRQGPGHSHRPPKYVVVFMDYLTKWVEAFPTAAITIATLLIELLSRCTGGTLIR